MRPMDRLYGDRGDGSAVVHLAVTNLAIWWSEEGKMMHTREQVFQRQVAIGLDLAGFDEACVGPRSA
jgi:hypothetical protein